MLLPETSSSTERYDHEVFRISHIGNLSKITQVILDYTIHVGNDVLPCYATVSMM